MTTMNLVQIKEFLSYNPTTGEMVYIKPTANRIKVGQIVGTPTTTGSRRVTFFGKRIEISRLIWFYMTGKWPKGVIDHINGNKQDNTWSNLRDVSQATNMSNKHIAQSNNRLGILGVDYINGRYRARLKYPEKKQVHIGMFDTAEEAHLAYKKERAKFHPVEGLQNYDHRSE